jgi:sodium/bile acid cotransporter 7
MKRFLIQRWFLIVLVLVLVMGITFAPHLRGLADQKTLRNLIVASVLFVMALPLEARAMMQSLRRPGPPLLATSVNMGLLPLFAWPVSFLLPGDLGPGLLVAATTPCTLASASVWTRRAGGNDAVSILVTIITNATCFLVTPLWLIAMTGQSVDSPELSLSHMSLKLGSLVVLPMALAQLLRANSTLATWATHRKTPLGVVAQCGVLTMVFLGAIRTGLRLGEEGHAIQIGNLLLMLGCVLLVHVAMLYTGLGIAKLSKFRREDQIAVAFAGSQKTLMVGLLVAISLQVSILPMITYHVSQLFVDTLIADRLRRQKAG